MKRHLPSVTLVAIDGTGKNENVAKALRISSLKLSYGDTLLIGPTSNYKLPPNTRHHKIEPMDYLGWNKFVLKSLGDLIKTDHYLYVDYDGFVLHPEAWTDEFLKYDYIGAPFTYPNHVMTKHVDTKIKKIPKSQINLVGNGGFTLRSKKFAEVAKLCKDTRYRPEDVYSCFNNYTFFINNGVKFCPVDLASKFSYNYLHHNKGIFGFHGDKNYIKTIQND